MSNEKQIDFMINGKWYLFFESTDLNKSLFRNVSINSFVSEQNHMRNINSKEGEVEQPMKVESKGEKIPQIHRNCHKMNRFSVR